MPKLPGVNHLRAVALEKAGFQVDRQGKHIFMSKGHLKVVVPRNNPVDAYTMAAIVRDAGLTVEQFKELLEGERDGILAFDKSAAARQLILPIPFILLPS